ncbi:MAG: hypothetical protein ACTHK5_12075 [Tsuneonella sp.]
MQRFAMSLCLMLAACGAASAPAPPPERDPAVEQALNDHLMSDPDLASENEGNAALTVISDHSLPLPAFPEGAAEDARVQAAELVGGSDKLLPPPAAQALPGELGDSSTAAELAAGLPGAGHCSVPLTTTATWAARMPAPWALYPGSGVTEAAGADAASCQVRVVRFLTPVTASDVLAFYTALARAARIGVRHRAAGEVHILEGARAGSAFRLIVRPHGAGLVEGTLALREG